MSRRLEVLRSVCELVAAALPAAQVLGIDNDAAAPTRLPSTGRAVVRSGDPGEPEITLGILTYSYSHRIPVELDCTPAEGSSREDLIDAMAAAIGAAVEADRTLGGLVEFLDVEALTTDDLATSGAQAVRTGDLAIVADYTTTNPLT